MSLFHIRYRDSKRKTVSQRSKVRELCTADLPQLWGSNGRLWIRPCLISRQQSFIMRDKIFTYPVCTWFEQSIKTHSPNSLLPLTAACVNMWPCQYSSSVCSTPGNASQEVHTHLLEVMSPTSHCQSVKVRSRPQQARRHLPQSCVWCRSTSEVLWEILAPIPWCCFQNKLEIYWVRNERWLGVSVMLCHICYVLPRIVIVHW